MIEGIHPDLYDVLEAVGQEPDFASLDWDFVPE